MNIASMAMGMLTPAIIGRIASALGINPTMAQLAISAGLPAILGSIVGKASQPSGLGALTGLLGQQNPSLLGNLGNLIGGSGQASMVSAGSSALSSLLGNSGTGALAGAIGKFAGLPEGASNSLLGMLAPVALGTIAQQQKASNLDASGLASMLAGQKENISAAMPKGFGDLLNGTGLLDGLKAPSVGNVAQSVGNAAQSASNAAHSAANSVRDAVPAAPTANSLMRWLPWLAAALLAVLAWNMLSSRGPAVPTVNKVMYNNVDVGAQASSVYEGLKTTLGSVKDEATATAAAPRLREAALNLDKMQDIAKSLPADGRKSLAGIFAGQLPGLEGLITSALKIPGAEGILKPILGQIVERLTGLAKS